MQVDTNTLPHQPYANPDGAVIRAWHPAHWASRMYLMPGSGYDFNTQANIGNFSFSLGGFQDARGSNDAGEFYIENVFEELDHPGEWFYNTTTKMLYLFNNATGGPNASSNLFLIPASAKTLVTLNGTQASPVVGVTFKAVGFRDTAYTYLDPHGMPSG